MTEPNDTSFRICKHCNEHIDSYGGLWEMNPRWPKPTDYICLWCAKEVLIRAGL